jgi:hypothetical protein
MEARHMAQEGSLPELAHFLTTADADMWDHKKAAQKAATAGTAAHDRFESFIHGRKFDPTPYPTQALEMSLAPFDAACEWASQSKLEVVEMEVSLVSEKYRFGGTRDGVLVGGKRSIFDVKTSKAIYEDMLCQLAAYAILDEEQGNAVDGGFHLLRFSKQEKPDDPVRFSHNFWSHLDQGREAFLLFRRAYDLMADLGRMVK